jgi:hypothetical protein
VFLWFAWEAPLLAFVVAFIGILSALMALQLERSRELGVLRANGLTPGQVWHLVTAQTGVLGTVAGLLALPAGLALALVMVHVVNRRSFGWTLDLHLGWDLPAETLALAVVGALLAGLYGVIDVLKFRWWAFPLVVVGMNSIAMYCMSMLLKPWAARTLEIHLGPDIFQLKPAIGPYSWTLVETATAPMLEAWEPAIRATLVGLTFWLACFWLYRQRIFIRI